MAYSRNKGSDYGIHLGGQKSDNEGLFFFKMKRIAF